MSRNGRKRGDVGDDGDDGDDDDDGDDGDSGDGVNGGYGGDGGDGGYGGEDDDGGGGVDGVDDDIVNQPDVLSPLLFLNCLQSLLLHPHCTSSVSLYQTQIQILIHKTQHSHCTATAVSNQQCKIYKRHKRVICHPHHTSPVTIFVEPMIS